MLFIIDFMYKPLISIITPTYNHEKYIDICIQSVLKQSYTNWEQIIIDDCSTDNTRSVVRKYTIQDKRITLIINDKKFGLRNLEKTYNRALLQCKGNLIAILEGDDYIPPDKLKIQIKPFMQDPSIAMSYGDWIMVSNQGIEIYLRSYGFDSFIQNKKLGDIAQRYAGLKFDICSPSVMINTQKLIKVGGFQKSALYPFTDIPTYLALSTQGSFAYQKEIVGYYRRSSQSGWFNFANTTFEMGRKQVASLVNAFLITNGISIPRNQRNELIKRKFMKRVSIIKNEILFKETLTNKVIIYTANTLLYLRILIYKVEQFLYHKAMRK